MSARNRREAEVAVVRPAQPRTTLHAVAGATERRLPGAMEVPIEQVSPDPGQPRQDWEHNGGARRLDELTESVREFGVLQPLVVREDGTIGDGRQRYVIIAGGRRYAAAQRAGLAAVPVVARSEESSRVRILQLVENLQRQDLSPIDEARAYQELIDLENLSPPTIAARLHLSAQHVRDRLRVLSDQVLADAVERQQISATAARDIMQLPDDAYHGSPGTRAERRGDPIERCGHGAWTPLRRRYRESASQSGTAEKTNVVCFWRYGGGLRRMIRNSSEKQTTFVFGGGDVSAIRASDATPTTAQIGASDESTGARTAINTVSTHTLRKGNLRDASDELASSAHSVALLIERALRDAQCTEVIAQIISQEESDVMEEWWLLVYRQPPWALVDAIAISRSLHHVMPCWSSQSVRAAVRPQRSRPAHPRLPVPAFP